VREQYGAGVRVAVHGRYLIFYIERENAVIIERILHGARHLDWMEA
jgi:toxin ParE1/3/4